MDHHDSITQLRGGPRPNQRSPNNGDKAPDCAVDFDVHSVVPRPLVNDSQAWLVEKGHSALCSSTTIAAAASSSSLTPPPPPPPSPTIIAWADDDPEHPYNFGTSKRATVIVLNIVSVINSTMSSSIPSNAVPYIAAEFGVPSPSSQLVLPISMFLVGYVVGPLIWAPVSEALGRRGPTLLSFACFTAATLACALAPSWPALLVFRLVAGAFASAPIAIVAGMFADVFREPHARGRAFSIIMVSTVFGPLIAPIISGFASPSIGWRWSFWIGLIFECVSFVPLWLFLPETYAPVLLARRAAAMRKEAALALAQSTTLSVDSPAPPLHAAPAILAPHDLERRDFAHVASVVLTRPLRMLFGELIVATTCGYLSLVYAIFYMTFQSFVLIFRDRYGLSLGVVGLCFLPIGLGAVLALPILWAYEDWYKRNAALARAAAAAAAAAGESERGVATYRAWILREEIRRLPTAVLGGPLFVVSLFWVGWTARAGSGVHFAVPMLAGIPFGTGFLLVFQGMLNYLTDAYGVFSASAHAAASTTRSLLAALLPLATAPMFAQLGIAGACSLLGGVSVFVGLVPWLFIAKGERIRAGSQFCLELKRIREEEDAQREGRMREKERVRMLAAGSVDTAVGFGTVARNVSVATGRLDLAVKDRGPVSPSSPLSPESLMSTKTLG